MAKTRSKRAKTSAAKRDKGPSLERPPYFQKHANKIFLGLIALLLVIFFHEAFFENKVFNVADNLSPILYEQGYLEKADAEGVNAFWNPYIFSGMPTWGSSSPGHGMYLHTFLDPLKPTLLLQIYGWFQSIINILPLPDIFWDVFNYFLLGLFTYFFGIGKGFDRFTSAIVAVSVVFSLYSLNWIMAGHNTKITVFAWLPAVLLLVDRLFRKRNLLTIALLIAALHLAFNSGHVQMIFYNMFAIGLYVLYKWYSGEKAGTVALVAVITVGAAAFAFLMLSGPYFATWEYKDFSIRGAGSGGSGHGSTGGGLDYGYATNWSFSPMEICTFFVPSFAGFGSPTYWGTMLFTESPIYLGIVISFLALLGIILKPKDKFNHFWIVLGLLALLIAMGRNFGVVYDLLFYNLPFFNTFRIPSMILYLNALCVGMLAGNGLTTIIRLAREKSRSRTVAPRQMSRIVGGVILGSVLLFVVLLMSESGMKSAITDNLQEYHPQSWNTIQQIEQAIAAGQGPQIPEEYRDYTVQGIYDMAVDDALVALLFICLTGGLIWSFSRGKISLTVFQIAVLLILLTDWWIVDNKPMRMQPRSLQEQAVQKTDVVRFLEQQQGLFRILPVSAHGDDNYYVGFSIPSVAGYHPAKMKYYDDIRNSLFNQFEFRSVEHLDASNWAILSMLNTKYVVIPSDMSPSSPWLEKVYSGSDEDVYENRYVLPRAFLVGRYEVLENDEEMFQKISTLPGYSPDRVAYLSKPIDLEMPMGADSLAGLSKVRFVEYGINHIVLDIETPVTGILKLSEVYYPSGWTATIDGEEADILRTDYTLRALIVPRGSHRIEMQFEPRTYTAGLVAATATNYSLVLVLLVYLVVWGRKKLAQNKKEIVSS